MKNEDGNEGAGDWAGGCPSLALSGYFTAVTMRTMARDWTASVEIDASAIVVVVCVSLTVLTMIATRLSARKSTQVQSWSSFAYHC